MCFDGTKRLCHIRGKLRKRQWINAQGTVNTSNEAVLMLFRHYPGRSARLSGSEG